MQGKKRFLHFSNSKDPVKNFANRMDAKICLTYIETGKTLFLKIIKLLLRFDKLLSPLMVLPPAIVLCVLLCKYHSKDGK